jgi:lipoprotein-anchoring transpeptidase ErfK/SrfK
MQKIAPTLLLLFSMAISTAAARTAIELDLTNQRAYLIKGGEIVTSAPIASGRASHPTPTGTYRVTQKSRDHRSSLYGMVIDSSGRVVKADADHETPVPRGGKFLRAPMRYFLRFNGAVGMHAGILPGYPASHGCVRLPSSRAALFYRHAQIGTPVRVYGRAPYRGTSVTSSKYSGTKRRTAPLYRRIPYMFQIF